MSTLETMDKKHLYLQVKNVIKDHLYKQHYRQGDQLPTNKEFAELTQVSQLTVQKAVNTLVQEGMLYTRRGKGTFVRDLTEKARAKEKTGLYACVVPTIQANTVTAVIPALDNLMYRSNGNHMIVCNSQCDLDREIGLLDSLLDRQVDVLIYQCTPLLYRRPVFSRAIDVRLKKFLSAGIPVVLLDFFPEPGQYRYDSVINNKKQMTELAVRYLVELGHRRLLFVGHPVFYRAKVEAFTQAVDAEGLRREDVRTEVLECDDIEVGADEILKNVLSDGWPFTAIVAASDAWAAGCYRYLKSAGIKCPEDVSILGADNIELIEPSDIHLTTVWSDPQEIAQQVQTLIQSRLGQTQLPEIPRELIEVNANLIVRQSSAPPSLRIGPIKALYAY